MNNKQAFLNLLANNNFSELENKLEAIIVEKNKEEQLAELSLLKGKRRQYERHTLQGIRMPTELDVEAAQLRRAYLLFIDQVLQSDHSKANGLSKWVRPALILLACLGLIFLGSMKWPHIDFLLEGKTRFLAFRIDENWDLNGDIYLKEFSSYTVKSVSLDTFQYRISDGDELEEVILSNDEDLKWQEMKVATGSVFNVDISDGQLNCLLFVDSLDLVFFMGGTRADFYHLDTTIIVGDDEDSDFGVLTLAEGPQFSFTPKMDSSFVFKLIPVSGLDFQRANLQDDPSLESELVEGQITARKITYSLQDAPYLDLIQPESTTLSFYQQGELLNIRVEGKAKDVTIGARPDTQKSVKPTIVEHLTQSAQANMIWTYVLGIIGFLGALLDLRKKFQGT